jgi:hypothetical protein
MMLLYVAEANWSDIVYHFLPVDPEDLPFPLFMDWLQGWLFSTRVSDEDSLQKLEQALLDADALSPFGIKSGVQSDEDAAEREEALIKTFAMFAGGMILEPDLDPDYVPPAPVVYTRSGTQLGAPMAPTVPGNYSLGEGITLED